MRIVRLGEVAKIERKSVMPADIRRTDTYLGLEHIEVGGRILARPDASASGLRSNKFQFNSEHVLMGKLRPNLAKIARPGFDGVCSTDILPIRPGHELDGDYLVHFLLQPSIVQLAASLATGVNLPRLSPSVLESFEVPLPTMQEQRRIAAILDQADALRAKRRQVLGYAQQLGSAIFDEDFGDVERNHRGWRTADLGDVVDRVTDGEHKTPRRADAGVPLLSARNIRDGWIDFSNCDFIDESEYSVLSRRVQPQSGDLLISCSGTIGRVAQVGDCSRFAMVRSAALVSPGSSVESTFLEYLLASHALKRIMLAQANSSAQANLFQNQIRRLPVFVPPIDLQRRFRIRIETIQRHVGQIQHGMRMDNEVFAAVQSRAFRGEL